MPSPIAQKGHKKQGGRKKGTPNQKTMVLDSFAQDITEGGMDKFRKELAKLRGAAYVKAYMALFEYVKPKLGRTELTVPPDSETTLTITRKVIAKRD
jgi:hypothetical protein